MQGRKNISEELFISFQLSDRVPKENLYWRLSETLDLQFLYKDTRKLFGKTGNPSIDPVVFFKLMLTGYPENITFDRRLLEHCSMRRDILYFIGYDIDEPFALDMIDWSELLMGILMVISGLLMIAYRVSQKDFRITYGAGQWIGAGIILIGFGCAMILKSA